MHNYGGGGHKNNLIQVREWGLGSHLVSLADITVRNETSIFVAVYEM